MDRENVINNTVIAYEPPVVADRSRCIRMRYNKNTCSLCTAHCRTGAITIDETINVNAGKCTECMLCVSECPSGCFTARDINFAGVLSRLLKIPDSLSSAVLGCTQTHEAVANVKIRCLGFLSEEYLLSLNTSLDKPVFLNLTACAGCRNSFAAQTVRDRLRRLEANISFVTGNKVLPANSKADLVYEEVPLNRRGFFQAIKTMSFVRVAMLIDGSDDATPLSYSEKRLPARRIILNTVVRNLGQNNAVSDILHAYAFTVKAGAACNHCFACVGMCSTGALKCGDTSEGPVLLFNSSQCTGCGLCAEFCPAAAIMVVPGFIGGDYFEYAECRAAPLSALVSAQELPAN